MSNWGAVSTIKSKKTYDKPKAESVANTDVDLVNNTGSTENARVLNIDKYFGSVNEDLRTDAFHWENEEGLADPMDEIFTNALNGRYKSMMVNHGPKDGYMHDQFKDLGLKAWDIGKYVKDMDTKLKSGYRPTEAEAKEYYATVNSKKQAFSDQWYNKARNSVYFNQKGKPRETPWMYLTEDNMLQSKKEHKLANQGMVLKDKFLNNIGLGTADTYFGFGAQDFYAITNKHGAYKGVKLNDAGDQKRLRKMFLPIVAGWGTKGLDLFDRGPTAVDRYENIERTIGLFDHAVSWVSKYGSPHDEGLKELAIKMQDYTDPETGKSGDMASLDRKSKRDYIKSHPREFNRLLDNMGFYGTVDIYNKFKGEFNDPKYYAGDNEASKQKSMNDSLNMASNQLRLHKEYKDTSKALRLDALELSIKDLGFSGSKEDGFTANTSQADMYAMIHSELLNGNGNIRSKAKVLDLVGKEFGRNGNQFDPGYRKFISKRVSDGNYEVSNHIGASEAGSSGSRGSRLKSFPNTETYSWNQMSDAYKHVLDTYKSSFGKINVKNVFEYTSKLQGMGYKQSQVLSFEDVDFKSDVPKSENAQNIIDMVYNSGMDSDIVSKNIGEILVTKGGFRNNISASGFRDKLDAGTWSHKAQLNHFKSFFKDRDKYKFDVDFSRVSPLAGKSAYSFTKLGTKESVTIYVDRNLAAKNNDIFVNSTSTSPYDWSFDVDGEWDMSWAQGSGKNQKGKNLKILQYDGHKILSGDLWDSDLKDGQGDWSNKFIDLGVNSELTINRAEEITQTILSQIKRN
jgi:hypothetical protein